jgi:hypothetical protein
VDEDKFIQALLFKKNLAVVEEYSIETKEKSLSQFKSNQSQSSLLKVSLTALNSILVD